MQGVWFFDAYWELLFLVLSMVIAFMWRPTPPQASSLSNYEELSELNSNHSNSMGNAGAAASTSNEEGVSASAGGSTGDQLPPPGNYRQDA